MPSEHDSTATDPPALSPTARTRLRRYPERGRTDRAELYDVLDRGLICFLGAVTNGAPRVIPMVYGRIGDTLYLHGSVVNQALVAAKNGGELCVTVLNIQGLVLANSLFHHSINFRCAMIYGTGRVVTDEAERLAALRAAANQLVPGRAESLPDPTPTQMAATLVIALPLAEASVKVREGWPNGDASDYARGIWSGVLPLVQAWGEPDPDPKMQGPIPVPPDVAGLVGQRLGDRPTRT